MIAQVRSVLRNPNSLDDAPHRVIYSELLNPEANKGLPPPTEQQLDHEARVLFAAGSHTIGTTLMIGVYHILRNPEVKQRLVDEVRAAWPVLDQAPSYELLEKLPYLASVFISSDLSFLLAWNRLPSSKRCSAWLHPHLLAFHA
jgi:cytochrome P450